MTSIGRWPRGSPEDLAFQPDHLEFQLHAANLKFFVTANSA